MPKTPREYCYTMDYNFYHNNGKTFTPITRKEYKEKTGESDYIIDKLRNSIWPYQRIDYFFIKISNSKVYTPIDWKIYNLVRYFNYNGFETNTSDQTGWYDGVHHNFGKILVKDNRKVIPFFLEIFDEKNIILSPTGSIFVKWGKQKSSKKLLITVKDVTFENKKYYPTVLYFKESNLPWIHEKLNLEFPDHSKVHSGRRIIDQSFGKNLDL